MYISIYTNYYLKSYKYFSSINTYIYIVILIKFITFALHLFIT